MPQFEKTSSETQSDTILTQEQIVEEFDTKAYLQDFYSHVDDPAMQMVVLFLPNIVKRIGKIDSLLDFGAGPTTHVATIFRNHAQNIYLADYLPQNRQELSYWFEGKSEFDWSETLRKIASAEGTPWQQIREMENVTRSKVKGIFHCDCHQKDCVSAPEHLKHNFDVVTTILCLEYSCSTTEEYVNGIKNVVGQVKPGGFFIIGGVLEETWCSFGGKKFMCFYVTEDLLFSTLRQCGLLIDDPKETICYNVNGMYLLCSRKGC